MIIYTDWIDKVLDYVYQMNKLKDLQSIESNHFVSFKIRIACLGPL